MPKISLHRWLMVALATAVLGGLIAGGVSTLPAANTPAIKAKGELSLEGLGNMLSALGVNAKKTDSRYDFAFAAKVGEKDSEEWELSMSVVLSDDEKSIWVMAWLDELPKSAADVPRTALLRLLADNDKMGNGQFFAYVSSNRRFLLQRVIANENITSATFREILVDLGRTVTEFHPDWSVANWKNAGATKDAAQAGGDGSESPAKQAAPGASGKGVIPAGTKTTTKAKTATKK